MHVAMELVQDVRQCACDHLKDEDALVRLRLDTRDEQRIEPTSLRPLAHQLVAAVLAHEVAVGVGDLKGVGRRARLRDGLHQPLATLIRLLELLDACSHALVRQARAQGTCRGQKSAIRVQRSRHSDHRGPNDLAESCFHMPPEGLSSSVRPCVRSSDVHPSAPPSALAPPTGSSSHVVSLCTQLHRPLRPTISLDSTVTAKACPDHDCNHAVT